MMRARDWFLQGASVLLLMLGSAAHAGSLAISPYPSSEPLSSWFTKRVLVFGVEVAAAPNVPDSKVLHAASVLAEYLDQDEDGVADDPGVVDAMLNNGALLVMFKNVNQLENSGIFDSDVLDERWAQDCLGDETNPTNDFDASLEEVLHLVHTSGLAHQYPDLAAEDGSRLSLAMDVARGGHFVNVPSNYPPGAWYHYDDSTCDYECQGAEYFYWGLTSILGAQADPDRCDEIEEEWELCNLGLVQSRDSSLYAILTDPQYGLPTRLPDGNYEVGSMGICGNGVIEASEHCDDGEQNGRSTSCCASDCQFKPNGPASCDGNACTRSDQCTDGQCSAGPCQGGAPCSFCGGTCVESASDCSCVF